MDKERIKKIVNNFIDSVDEIQDLTISDEMEEIDVSTLSEERIIRRPTGRIDMRIIAYEE